MARAFSGLKSIKFPEDFQPKFLINALRNRNFEKDCKINVKIQLILGMIDIKLKYSKHIFVSIADLKNVKKNLLEVLDCNGGGPGGLLATVRHRGSKNSDSFLTSLQHFRQQKRTTIVFKRAY